MRSGFFKSYLSLFAIGLGVWWMQPARAALGGDAASVIADAAQLQGVDRTTSLAQYTIHELTTDSGMRIREFLNVDGIVFAVTWSGPVTPDLPALLGASFSAYAATLKGMNQRGLHRAVRIATAGLVVETGGHMRAVNGRAYLPAMVPAGTPASDLR